MSVDPEIFAIFQHKVEQIPHFTQVTEVRHIYVVVIQYNCHAINENACDTLTIIQ